MSSQFFIVDAIEVDADPAAHSDVSRAEVYLRRCINQHRLQARWGWYQHGDMPVVVMVVRKHGKDFLANEEGWLAVREFFRALRHGGADSPHSPQVFSVHI